MINKPQSLSLILLLCLAISGFARAASWELIFKEEEPGVEPYLTRMTVTDHHLRIDDLSDDSGFILFDRDDRRIYSVNHDNRTTLIIDAHKFDAPVMDKALKTTDTSLEDAPLVAGKRVRDYRVEWHDESDIEVCTHIQYVPGLLAPEVGAVLAEYQRVMAGNNVHNLEATPEEYRTPCMLSDQVYFDGAIYRKGLPIMQWHSNGRQRFLQNYREVEPEAGLFDIPEDYRELRL